LIILVDFHNVDVNVQRCGIKALAEKLLELIGHSPLQKDKRVEIRLYGGWYDGRSPSRLCQQLTAEIHSQFPRVTNILDSQKILAVHTRVDLVYSLAAEPRKHLFYTYRRRMPQGLICLSQSEAGCKSPECPLPLISQFISTGRCPQPGCFLRTDAILFRDEQKLVDTMLAVDLIHYITKGEPEICVVTNDTDLWPAIKFALILGARIHHIHPKAGRMTPNYYTAGLGSEYRQISF
jgi:hypothetical protein